MARARFRSRSAWLAAGALLIAWPTAAQEAARQVVPPSIPASAAAQARDDRQAQCRALQEAYARSQACYQKYRGVHGVRPEAFQACGPELLDPGPDCSAVRIP